MEQGKEPAAIKPSKILSNILYLLYLKSHMLRKSAKKGHFTIHGLYIRGVACSGKAYGTGMGYEWMYEGQTREINVHII
jgi:hypothetical protein